MTTTLTLTHRHNPILPCWLRNPAFTSLPIEAILARFEYVRPPICMEGRRQRTYERCSSCRRPYCDKYEPCGVCKALDKLLTAKGAA